MNANQPKVNVNEPSVSEGSKWQDLEWVRWYRREQKRKNGKRHPNLMDDGRLWSEVYPHNGFSSKREYYDALKQRYRPNTTPKEICEVCGSSYYTTQKEKHLVTKKHQTFFTAYQKGLSKNLVDSSVLV